MNNTSSLWIKKTGYIMTRNFLCMTSVSLIILLLGACTIGPEKIKTDRFDYATAVGESFKEQTLLNIVKLRHHEWPLFLSVEQIVTQYTQEHTGVMAFDIREPFKGDWNNYKPSYIFKYNERPTIRMVPVRGKAYAATMLTPMNPATVFALIEAGWPAEKLLRTGVSSINGKHNAHFEFGVHYRADPAFARFTNLFNRLQQKGAISIEILVTSVDPVAASRLGEPRLAKTVIGKVPTTVRLRIAERLLDDELKKELSEVKALLNLDPVRNTFKIVYSDDAVNADTLAVETRSILQVMAELASYVQVSDEDIASGRIAYLQPVPEEDATGFRPLVRVRSGPVAPATAFIAVPYRGHWFWIAGTDHSSKRTFTFLSIMMNVIESDQQNPGGQIVIPVRDEELSPSKRDAEDEEEKAEAVEEEATS